MKMCVRCGTRTVEDLSFRIQSPIVIGDQFLQDFELCFSCSQKLFDMVSVFLANGAEVETADAEPIA